MYLGMMLRREWRLMDRGDRIVLVVLLSKLLVDVARVWILFVVLIGWNSLNFSMYLYIRDWGGIKGIDISVIGVGVVEIGWIIRIGGDICSWSLLQWFGNSISVTIRRVKWWVVVVAMFELCIVMLFLTIYLYQSLYSEWYGDIWGGGWAVVVKLELVRGMGGRGGVFGRSGIGIGVRIKMVFRHILGEVRGAIVEREGVGC